MKISKILHAESRAVWREWLHKNHATQEEVWLVFFKKQIGKAQIVYDEAVEEALCFGWIDSIIQNIDDEKFARKFTPRKKGSKWSALNKKRAALMIREGKMTKSGLAVFNCVDAEDDYGRTKERAQRNLVPPPFIEQAFKQNKQVWDNFLALAPSYRRNYIGWISAAKTEETRDRRLKEAITLLAKNEKLGMK